MSHPLGLWAVIDIETTGADASYDEVIDLGYLQFEGTQCVKRFQSLVRTDIELSQFIQRLTGITPSMVKKAPRWQEVEPDLLELEGHGLIAHNASFEAGFLQKHFERHNALVSFEDSLPFLGLLFPHQSRLGLEHFIVEWGLRTEEVHRGFEDSLDLLKVILGAAAWFGTQSFQRDFLEMTLTKHQLQDWWFARFFRCSRSDLDQIAGQIELDLDLLVMKIQSWVDLREDAGQEVTPKDFSLEFSGENIKQIWREEKKVGEKFPGYVFRNSQEELSLRVGQSFKNHVHALVQAPTGTGKTMGYLLPSALFSLSEKQQVLVATGTKTLQHQAMKKDVPALRKLLGLTDQELKVRLLVGSNNHFCELLYRQEEQEQDLFSEAKGFEEKFTSAYFDHLFYLNGRSDAALAMTRADMAYVLKRKFAPLEVKEREIAVDYRACTGQQCPFKGECGYLRGLREAKDADIIVGNHALMFSWTKSFPRPSYIVVDEAHKIESEATSAATMEVTGDLLKQLSKNLANLQGVGALFYLLAQFEDNPGQSSATINDIRQKVLEAQQMLDDHLRELPAKIEDYAKRKPRYTASFWNEFPCPTKKERDPLGVGIYHHFESLTYILTGISQALLPYRDRWDVKMLKEDNQVMALTRFETFAGHIDDLEIALRFSLGIPEEREDFASSLKYHEQFGFALSAAPIDVGQFLHDGLLQTSASVVYTSATLGNAHGDQGARGIEWATGYSYLESTRRFKSGFFLPSIYDYKEKTKIYLCDDVPVLHSPEFTPKVLKEISGLIHHLEGRSLLLFSARARFEIAREILLRDFQDKIPIFIQGMGNDVVEDFKRSGRGILLGMESFGEGIDIPGEALQFVFIDKIPDIRMDYVIQKRRDFYDARLGNEFTDYYLSHRTRSLHQKLGRLLRKEDDYGGVIIVDSRVKSWKGRTMSTLLKLMEPYELQRASLKEACQGIQDFIDQH